MEDTATDPLPDLSAAALREWQQLTEQLLRGIAHSLNNRAAAISAVLELSRDPDEDGSATTAILGSEFERVQQMVMVLRAIGTPLPRVDAFDPGDAAREARIVLGFHAEQRYRAVRFDAEGAPPTRVPRWLFVRALIALGADASRDSDGEETPVTVIVEGDADWLVARVASRAVGAVLSCYGTELAAAMGGEPLRGALGFRVPSLAAIRRREGH
jgi:hypothetical protein